VILIDDAAQRALGDELNDGVDREVDVFAIDRPVRTFAADLVHATPRVAQQRDAAGAPAHLRVERVLDPAETLAIEPDVSNDIRCQHSARIGAAMLFEIVDAGQAQRFPPQR